MRVKPCLEDVPDVGAGLVLGERGGAGGEDQDRDRVVLVHGARAVDVAELGGAGAHCRACASRRLLEASGECQGEQGIESVNVIVAGEVTLLVLTGSRTLA